MNEMTHAGMEPQGGPARSLRSIRDAASLVHDNKRLLLLLACTGAYVTCHTAAVFTAVGLGLTIFLLPAVYARFAQAAAGENAEDLLPLFVRYAPAFFTVTALFYVPVLAAAYFVPSEWTAAFLTVLFGALQVLALFVLPLLFRGARPLHAAGAGMRMLVTEMAESFPLVLLAIAMPILSRIVPTEWYAIDLSSLHAGMRTAPAAYGYLLARSYGDAVVFSAACFTLRTPQHALLAKQE